MDLKSITPTIGRIVWYWPTRSDVEEGMISGGDQPLPAVVCHVWTDHCVNLGITDAGGVCHARTSINLVQPGDMFLREAGTGGYCEWMPYQVKVAQKDSSEITS